MYCWEICLEALCSVLRSEPWSRHREARQRDYGKKPPGPVSVLGHDYHFKIEVGLPTCTAKCEDGSHSVLGNPRRGWRSVWVSVFKFHRKSQKLLGSSFETIYFPWGEWPVMAVFPLPDLGSRRTTILKYVLHEFAIYGHGTTNFLQHVKVASGSVITPLDANQADGSVKKSRGYQRIHDFKYSSVCV